MFTKSGIFWFLLINSSLMVLYPRVKVVFGLPNIYKFTAIVTGYFIHNATYFIGRKWGLWVKKGMETLTRDSI